MRLAICCPSSRGVKRSRSPVMTRVGTAITTGVLAALAVGFKGLARGVAGVDNKATGIIVWWAELLAAFGVFAFGIVLLLASL